MVMEMKRLRKQGLTYKRISERLAVAYQTVQYHLNDEYRKRHMEQAKERERKKGKDSVSESRRKRNKEYLYDRYHHNEEFRKKIIRANQGFKFKE